MARPPFPSPPVPPVASTTDAAPLRRAERALRERRPERARADHPALIATAPGPLLYRLGILEAEAGAFGPAAALLQAARARMPGDADVTVNLAQALLGAGDPGQAADLLAGLSASARRHPAVARLAGLALAACGRPAEALEPLSRARSAGARDPALLNALGVALRARGRLAEAASAFGAALEGLPAPAPGIEIRANLAGLLLRLERPEQAAGVLEAGLERVPASAALRRHRAAALRLLGPVEPAAREACRAVCLDPADAAGATLLAEMAENRAELDRADRWTRRGLALAPGDLAATRLRVRLARRNRQEARAIELADAWLERETAPERRYPILFEAGLALDALKRPEAAYERFAEANDAQRRATPAGIGDPARVRRQLDRLDALLAGGWRPQGPVSRADSAPAFLVGFPRSGTTLLDQVLDAHPDVAVIEERPLIPELIARLAAGGRRYPDALPALSGSELADLRQHYQQALSRFPAVSEARLVIDKMPLNLAHAALIRLVFPDARFVVALRDPCDVVLSCFMQAFQLNDWMAAFLTLDGAADLYHRVFGHWRRARAALDLPHVTVRYEDVVADLPAAVTPVLRFLGLDWRPGMAAFDEHARSRGRLGTPSAGQVTRPIYTDALARWRRYDAVMAPIAEALRPWRIAHGYVETDQRGGG